MDWRSIILPSVLAAGCLMGACRETTPTTPSSVTERGSSQQSPDSTKSAPISSRPAPQPPNPSAPPSASSSCDATKAQWAIGQRAGDPLLERARVAAGAESARFLRPDQPVTMEYLRSRLNLGVDARDIVRSVACG
jgi:Peptidase inhibitor I78 family